MKLRVACAAFLALSGTACVSEYTNPFQLVRDTRPIPAEADLLLAANLSQLVSGVRDVVAVDLDGTAPVQLTSCFESIPVCDVLQASAAPDRVLVAVLRRADANNDSMVASDEPARVFIMDLARAIEGGILETSVGITSIDWTLLQQTPVLFSAEGVGGLDDVYAVNANGTELQSLTSTETIRERHPRFEPGLIVYERIEAGAGSEIWAAQQTGEFRLVAALGGEPPVALPGTPYIVGGNADPDPSPDGLRVAFRRLTGLGTDNRGTWDILTIGSDGTIATVAAGGAFRGAPDWGPRGIVFVEVPDGAASAKLVLVGNDGERSEILTGLSLAAQSPRWLP